MLIEYRSTATDLPITTSQLPESESTTAADGLSIDPEASATDTIEHMSTSVAHNEASKANDMTKFNQDMYLSHVRINKKMRVLVLKMTFDGNNVGVTTTTGYGEVDPSVATNYFGNSFGIEFSIPENEDELKTQIIERINAARHEQDPSNNVIQIIQIRMDDEVKQTFDTNIIPSAEQVLNDLFPPENIGKQAYEVRAGDLMVEISKQLQRY